MTSTSTLTTRPTNTTTAARQRRTVVVASLISSIAEDSPAGRRAAIGQLVAIGYTRDEIAQLEHDATRILHTLIR
jgi:hypothetical protein